MEETSSKYVDQIVMEKIVAEKLSQVHHGPDCSFTELLEPLYEDFSSIDPLPAVNSSGENTFSFPSPLTCAYPENNTCTIRVKSPPAPKASLLFVHGLYEDNREIHTFLLKELMKAGYRIYMMTLPYHYGRKPAGSAYSGEYFWSAHIRRTKQAFKQGVYELYQFYNFVKGSAQHPVYITAFSMGAGLALTLAALDAAVQGIFLINPVCSLSKIVWDSPLCRTIKADLLSSGLTEEQIFKVYETFEPTCVGTSLIDRKRICLGYGLYDQITSKEQYLELKKKWHLIRVIEYHAGHQNMLRVPRLAMDIDAFFLSLAVQG